MSWWNNWRALGGTLSDIRDAPGWLYDAILECERAEAAAENENLLDLERQAKKGGKSGKR